MNLRRQKLSQAASLSAERCLKNPMPPQQVVDLQMLALRHAATPLSTADHPIAAEHGDYVMNVVRRRVRQTVERRHRGLLQKQPGIAVAYAFASPVNRDATGPYDRFKAMVQQSFGMLLGASQRYRVVTEEADKDHSTMLLEVTNGVDKRLFLFELRREPLQSPLCGMWRTTAVRAL